MLVCRGTRVAYAHAELVVLGLGERYQGALLYARVFTFCMPACAALCSVPVLALHSCIATVFCYAMHLHKVPREGGVCVYTCSVLQC